MSPSLIFDAIAFTSGDTLPQSVLRFRAALRDGSRRALSVSRKAPAISDKYNL
jgi:hypothetical protein